MLTEQTRHAMPSRFLSIRDFDHDTLDACLALAARLKAARDAGTAHERPLEGRHVALLFEKPSLRTRATFQIAVHELGGQIIEPPSETVLGGRETMADVARNLERWVYAAVVRTFAQARLEEFAAAAPRLRVVNALSNEEHPCQALADCMTLQEHWGTLGGRTIVFVGDGNNVARSLAQAAVMLGARVRVAAPAGYALPDAPGDFAALARHGGSFEQTTDPIAAVRDADAVYTDVWTSMGQEAESAARRAVFAAFQVNAALMSYAAPDALFMHCLPAHRGEEVTDEVMDADESVVFDQAENRLHVQKALLTLISARR